MGLFDIAESMLSSALSGGTLGTSQPGGLNTQDVLGTVMGALNNHPGGLGGVVQSLSQGGLSDVVNGWIGNGTNPPVTAGQIQRAAADPSMKSPKSWAYRPTWPGRFFRRFCPTLWII